MPPPKTDQSDWDWVKKLIADDAPVPYDAGKPTTAHMIRMMTRR